MHLTNLSKHYLLSRVYTALRSSTQTLQVVQQVSWPNVSASNRQSRPKPQTLGISVTHEVWEALQQDTACPARRLKETQLAGKG